MKNYILIGAIFAGLAVIIGAFGAHALKDLMSENNITTFETGNRYHFYHSLALIMTAFVAFKVDSTLLKYACISFIVGIVFFSGSLYLLALRDGWELHSWTWLGPITPIGGLFFIIGWILMIVGILKSKEREE
jgi:uncharacterized membrane protein YgdD (TMEM256/DUF423 family)